MNLRLALIWFLILLVGCSPSLQTYGKRGGEETYSLGYWITPDEVSDAASEIVGDSEGSSDKALRLYLYVTDLEFTLDEEDFWQLPQETIEKQSGDCEDLAFLLHSLFLASNLDSELIIGEFEGEGHSWVVYQGRLFEPGQYSYPMPMDSPCYSDYVEKFRIRR